MAASFERVRRGLDRILHRSTTIGLLSDAMEAKGQHQIARALGTLMHDIDVELEEITENLDALEDAQ